MRLAGHEVVRVAEAFAVLAHRVGPRAAMLEEVLAGRREMLPVPLQSIEEACPEAVALLGLGADALEFRLRPGLGACKLEDPLPLALGHEERPPVGRAERLRPHGHRRPAGDPPPDSQQRQQNQHARP